MKTACAILSLSVFLLLGMMPPVGCAAFALGARDCPFMGMGTTAVSDEGGCDSPCCGAANATGGGSNFLQCLLHDMPCCVKSPKDVTPAAAVQAPVPDTSTVWLAPSALSLAPAAADVAAQRALLPEPTGPPLPRLYLKHGILLI